MPPAFWQKNQANLDDLQSLRHFIHEQTLALGLKDAETYDLNLAVTEAVTNIIVHGYGGQPGPIMVAVESQDDGVVVQIRDQALPFDPHTIPIPDLSTALEERSLGGLGFYLIQASVDQVTYETLPEGGNLLKLLKNARI